jgi:hypothetical protein
MLHFLSAFDRLMNDFLVGFIVLFQLRLWNGLQVRSFGRGFENYAKVFFSCFYLFFIFIG